MNEDLVIQKLLNHDERLDRIEKNMANKDDVDKILQGQDKMIQLFTRIDQERVFTNMKIVKQRLQLA